MDEELYRLSEKLRVPLVLCYLEGRTYEEAARQLNWPLGTVKKRLSQGRELLRKRLTRRGVAQGVIAVVMAEWTRDAAAAALCSGLLHSGLRSALSFGASKGLATDPVALAENMLHSMAVVKWKLALGLFIVLGGAIGVTGSLGIHFRPAPSEPLSQDENHARQIATVSPSFVNEAKREKQRREEVPRRHERWLAYSQRICADPRLIFYYTFQNQQPQDNILRNRALNRARRGITSVGPASRRSVRPRTGGTPVPPAWNLFVDDPIVPR